MAPGIYFFLCPFRSSLAASAFMSKSVSSVTPAIWYMRALI